MVEKKGLDSFMFVIKLFQRTRSAKRTKAYDKQFIKMLNLVLQQGELE